MEIRKSEPGTPAAIANVEIQTWLKLRAKRHELTTVEGGTVEALTDALIAGTATPAENPKLLRLRDEVRDLAGALATLRNRRIVAMEAIRRAKADAIRAEAIAARAKLEELSRKSSAVIAKLSLLEEIDLSKMLNQPFGEWSGFLVPASSRLQFEIDNLEQTAVRIEAQPLDASGSVDGADLESLIREMYANPVVLTPPIPAVEYWHDQVLKRAEEFAAKEFPTPFQRPEGVRFHLEWGHEGVISGKGSFIEKYGGRIGMEGATALPPKLAVQEIIPEQPLPPMERNHRRIYA